MDICRLCLKAESQNISNPTDIINILKKFLPSMNPCLKHSVFQLCETCLCNIHTLKNLKYILNKTDEKIKLKIRNSKGKEIDLINLLETTSELEIKTKNIHPCRICLQIIYFPKIFLYENNTNILRHDLIQNMFQFCNITLKCDLFQQPVMCLQCWESIQVCYSFKKNYLETNNKIQAYLIQFNISNNTINEEILKSMSQYFYSDINEIIKNKDFCDNRENIGRRSLRRNERKRYNNHTIKENPTFIETEHSDVVLPKRTRYTFTAKDDKFLLKFYYEVTSTNIASRPWKIIQEKWFNHFPENPLKISSIHSRLTTLLKQKRNTFKPLKSSTKNNFTVKKRKTKNIFNEFHPECSNEESDNYVCEVTPFSFVTSTIPVPSTDNKMEQFVDMPPSGTDSDCESLPIPLLERMDLPEIWKVDRHSVESKRKIINQIFQNGTNNTNAIKGDTSSYKRIQKRLKETMYKCNICNFETKYQYSADRHADWHAKPEKKGFECSKCYFITSKRFLLKKHITDKHQNEEGYEELPVLIPFTITY
ncbi:uncharacterized protein LOC130442417 isoform X1 [Diorhabda sublineata]|uniref:uncharacterized protein LOC130442417 isoform X1 n=1 Tax=Diorhabda sublineata TaxID=1163346 RepID=UPI0024E0528A|nr:uncharacterized protein LOC130442417 isoform X1 [Diorhabda sublineata]